MYWSKNTQLFTVCHILFGSICVVFISDNDEHSNIYGRVPVLLIGLKMSYSGFSKASSRCVQSGSCNQGWMHLFPGQQPPGNIQLKTDFQMYSTVEDLESWSSAINHCLFNAMLPMHF